jgi:hypothetical protein
LSVVGVIRGGDGVLAEKYFAMRVPFMVEVKMLSK